MAWSDSDLIAAGYSPRSGKRLVRKFKNPVSPGSIAGHGGEHGDTHADSKNASAAAVGAVNVVPGRSGWPGDAGVPRQLSDRCDPGCCCRVCRPRWSDPPALSAYARSRLQPEQLLQVQVIEQLRPRMLAGAKLIAINGELPGGTHLFRMWQAVRKAMGYLPGTPDLLACHGGRVGFIELKRARSSPDLFGHTRARGELSREQRAWRDWCHEHGYGWTVARSVPEVETTLSKWGMI